MTDGGEGVLRDARPRRAPQDEEKGGPLEQPGAEPTFELPYLVDYTPEAMIAEIRRVAALVEHPILSVRRFNRLSRVDANTIIRHFVSWKTALARAGLVGRFSGSKGMREKKQTDEEILSDIRQVAAKRKLAVLRPGELEQDGVSTQLLRLRFGSVATALKKAGVGHRSLSRKRGAAECYRNLAKVWLHYGRAPLLCEIKQPPSTIGIGPYMRLYGGWKPTLAAFAARAERDPKMKAALGAALAARKKQNWARPRKAPEDTKNIRVSLRFQVLDRDRYRCTACGANPAADLACKLHVDHITPWSKGGKTVIANLRTLCAACNMGKGARVVAP